VPAGPVSADGHPYLTELAVERVLQPGYRYGGEPEIGPGLILDASSGQPGGLTRPARLTWLIPRAYHSDINL
jgi:hypothetical protein